MGEKLTAKQAELLRALPPYRRVRWGSGHIERQLVLNGRVYQPRTFNALVERGLAWGVDHTYGRISAGRLPTPVSDA